MRVPRTLVRSLALFAAVAACSAWAGAPLAKRLLNLDDPGYNDALSEMQALDHGGKAKLSSELARIARSSKSVEERANAVSALGDLSPEVPENTGALVAALKDAAPPVRQSAISGLQRAGKPSPKVVAALSALLADRSPGVVAKVLDAFSGFGPAARSAAPAIRKLLKHQDTSVRELAAAALKSIEGK